MLDWLLWIPANGQVSNDRAYTTEEGGGPRELVKEASYKPGNR